LQHTQNSLKADLIHVIYASNIYSSLDMKIRQNMAIKDLYLL